MSSETNDDINFYFPFNEKLNNSLEDMIITLSGGIGRSVKEAELALKKAKKRKKDKLKYNVAIYIGNRLRDDSFINKEYKEIYNAISDLERKIELLSNEKERSELKEYMDKIKKIYYDPKTKLLTELGYYAEIKNKNNSHGFYILLDGDNMHEWNDKIGYKNVDLFLSSIGQGILESLRHYKDGNNREIDYLAKRMHNSAGDEFLIWINTDINNEEDYIKKSSNIVKRIIDSCYYKESLVSYKEKNIYFPRLNNYYTRLLLQN